MHRHRSKIVSNIQYHIALPKAINIFAMDFFLFKLIHITREKNSHPIFKWLQVIPNPLAILIFNWPKINSLVTKKIQEYRIMKSENQIIIRINMLLP